MARDDADRFVDLDDEDGGRTSVLIRYKGLLTAISRDRLLELLRREEIYIETIASHEPAKRAPREGAREHVREATPRKPQAEPTVIPPDGQINHAGLSVRIKRMYNYSIKSRELRPTHATHLSEILEQFDWQIPEYPNSQLDFHLKEICDWAGVDAELRVKVEAFLKRYTDARYRRTA